MALLLVVGIALDAYGVLDWRAVVEWGRGYAGWPLALAIVAGQVLLYMLAQPASAMFWIAALLFPPLAATAILITGATLGALAAYWFVGRLLRRGEAVDQDFPLRATLARHGDFFTLCALRLMPGVPHALVNYSAALLRLPLGRFVASTLLGLSVKTYVYVTAVFHMAEEASISGMLKVEVLGPLVALGVLLLVVRFALRRRAV